MNERNIATDRQYVLALIDKCYDLHLKHVQGLYRRNNKL